MITVAVLYNCRRCSSCHRHRCCCICPIVGDATTGAAARAAVATDDASAAPAFADKITVLTIAAEPASSCQLSLPLMMLLQFLLQHLVQPTRLQGVVIFCITIASRGKDCLTGSPSINEPKTEVRLRLRQCNYVTCNLISPTYSLPKRVRRHLKAIYMVANPALNFVSVRICERSLLLRDLAADYRIRPVAISTESRINIVLIA